MILIGSKAIKFHVPEWRQPLDTDLVGTYEEAEEYQKKHRPKVCYPISSGDSIYMKFANGEITEIEVAWQGSRAEKFINFVMQESDTVCLAPGKLYVPSLDVLYLLKMSHRHKKDSPWFKKTMDDILALRKLGAKIRPEHQKYYEQRQRDTYHNTLPKLNQSKKDFFSEDQVPYVHDHDATHWAVKFLAKPAYMFFKEDESEVAVSREMFEALPEEIKLYSVVEEAMVLAIERALTPFPDGMNPKQAFDFALSKCCTSIASGFWREFAWENYYAVQELYDDTYHEKFKKALDEGKIPPYKQ